MSFFKKEKTEQKNYADADVQTQLARIIEQLGFLERKIDGLSQNRSPRPGGPGGRPGFGRPGGHFSGGHSNGGFRSQGGGGGFRPQGSGGFRGNRDNHRGDRRPSGPRHSNGPRPHTNSHSSAPQQQAGGKGDNFGNI